jgi:hypothetical protein
MYGMYLHVYACIYMYVPKSACCQQQRMALALVGATLLEGNTTESVRSSQCSANSISNEVMMIFIFQSAASATTG